MEIILLSLLGILILAFIIISFVKLKYKAFFLLGLLSFIAIIIFSSFLVFFINNGKITFQDYSLILTKGKVSEIVFKDKPSFYLSGEILSGTTFSGIVYELQGNNFINKNTYLTGIDLSNYITKSEAKDFFMDSYNKRIEGMQNQINVFLAIISVIGTLLLFLGYKNFNDIDEKTKKEIKEYINDDSKGKKIIDDKITEYIKGEEGKKIIDDKITEYIKGEEGKKIIDDGIKSSVGDKVFESLKDKTDYTLEIIDAIKANDVTFGIIKTLKDEINNDNMDTLKNHEDRIELLENNPS